MTANRVADFTVEGQIFQLIYFKDGKQNLPLQNDARNEAHNCYDEENKLTKNRGKMTAKANKRS